ncbi:hypothetical protein FVE85_8065 [Porphyridium purpureum]|uniref:Uncharacterized protein n=1 Tax=Porphyridium purpureum TaxID=35688 RepID=A0A5J4YMU0_PORPP|nr:hypothetical protein FVE85_8065 [Porphyridium purpureum]|eukprot:POR3256..scf295_9
MRLFAALRVVRLVAVATAALLAGFMISRMSTASRSRAREGELDEDAQRTYASAGSGMTFLPPPGLLGLHAVLFCAPVLSMSLGARGAELGSRTDVKECLRSFRADRMVRPTLQTALHASIDAALFERMMMGSLRKLTAQRSRDTLKTPKVLVASNIDADFQVTETVPYSMAASSLHVLGISYGLNRSLEAAQQSSSGVVDFITAKAAMIVPRRRRSEKHTEKKSKTVSALQISGRLQYPLFSSCEERENVLQTKRVDSDSMQQRPPCIELPGLTLRRVAKNEPISAIWVDSSVDPVHVLEGSGAVLSRVDVVLLSKVHVGGQSIRPSSQSEAQFEKEHRLGANADFETTQDMVSLLQDSGFMVFDALYETTNPSTRELMTLPFQFNRTRMLGLQPSQLDAELTDNPDAPRALGRLPCNVEILALRLGPRSG